MKQHIFTGTTAPVAPPEGIGHHYIDTVAKKTYVSVGTALISDWKLDDGSSLVENSITPGVTTKAPSQDAVYNALLGGSNLQANTIAANLTIPTDYTLIRGTTRIADGFTLKINNNGTLKVF